MPLLQSITSFFSPANPQAASSSRHATRRSVMNSTFDAFSLPTANNLSGNYGDGLGVRGNDVVPQADSVASSPGPSRRASSSYTSYPPAQDTYRPALAYFPPLSHTFHRLRNALADSFPELLETLNSPVDPSLLASFEAELGCPLPPPVRDSFLIADGQDLESASSISGSGGIFFGLHLLPLEEVMREWSFWRQAEDDPTAGQNPAVLATMASVPPHWIKGLYACRGWLPLLSDRTGNYVGVDLDPGQGGSWGQVIVFGRDFDRKCVLWRGEGEGGWGKWLASFVDELESGEGWEADKASSSDEDEDAGYGSYNGGQTYGEAGKGLRLAGEYRGWGVLEAWWDKSVRRWEELGLGLDVDEVERGLAEARRLAGLESKGKEQENPGLGIGMRVGESAAQVEIPVIGSPHLPPAPSTPVPRDSDVLLPPASPDNPAHRRRPQTAPVRVITPISTSHDHPLAAKPMRTSSSDSAGYLSPPSRSSPRRRTSRSIPAPASLDLPTRADVQAMHAIARAEQSGLRGGWVMAMDTSAAGAARRARANVDSEMVDIDLESGKIERFGPRKMSIEEMERQREDERLALAGLEHRRSPHLVSTSRAPSPLAHEVEIDATPKAASRPNSQTISDSVVAATTALRRPPPLAGVSDSSTRGREREEQDQEVIRGVSRMERESSVVSTYSQDGLLDAHSSRQSSASPPLLASPMMVSPTTVTDERMSMSLPVSDSLDAELQEISLEPSTPKAEVAPSLIQAKRASVRDRVAAMEKGGGGGVDKPGPVPAGEKRRSVYTK
ncbi:hypothetical protein BCR39DRAFT_493271 [Naematelia encephala]|uniref:Knr4/Smi1-like domain-containing protein n=1 Tax=Naematelia encephala TaxID=71784 RepID=A0A1Y2BBT9_9TREE|nr:hypothetical protein BCR39DRAFT_493271 [Naematelia encephala]